MLGGSRKARSREELAAKFEALGVRDIDSAIAQELDPNANPRLAPLVLCHNLWNGVLEPEDVTWLENAIREVESRKQLTGAAAAMWPTDEVFMRSLHAVVESGIDLRHITTIVRRAQVSFLYHVAYTLSDSHSDEEILQGVDWAVFETDEAGRPLRQINQLHEYCSMTDPTREDD